MKTKQVKFICDSCGKNTEFHKECRQGTKPHKEEHPYEYKNGWVYCHSVIIRLHRISINLRDKHFCCSECFLEFLRNEIDVRKKLLIVDKLK